MRCDEIVIHSIDFITLYCNLAQTYKIIYFLICIDDSECCISHRIRLGHSIDDGSCIHCMMYRISSSVNLKRSIHVSSSNSATSIRCSISSASRAGVIICSGMSGDDTAVCTVVRNDAIAASSIVFMMTTLLLRKFHGSHLLVLKSIQRYSAKPSIVYYYTISF